MLEMQKSTSLVFQWSPSIWNYGVMIFCFKMWNNGEVSIATLYEQIDFKDILADKEKLIKCALTINEK